jgi:hypothetical protein
MQASTHLLFAGNLMKCLLIDFHQRVYELTGGQIVASVTPDNLKRFYPVFQELLVDALCKSGEMNPSTKAFIYGYFKHLYELHNVPCPLFFGTVDFHCQILDELKHILLYQYGPVVGEVLHFNPIDDFTASQEVVIYAKLKDASA